MKLGRLFLILLLAFYISVSALGVNVLNKCAQTDDSEKLQNIKGYFSHTLAMALGVVTTLLTLQLFTAELSAFYVLFSLMGAVGAFMLIHVINECDPDDKKGKMGYAGFSAALNLLMLIICLFICSGVKVEWANRAALRSQNISCVSSSHLIHNYIKE